ncbi:hypothetical protein BH09BAC2_BH09BAC2_07880 [soil metagenome]
MDIENHIQNINAKLQQLLKNHTTLQKENKHLDEQVNELKEKDKQQQLIIESMHQQILILKAATLQMDENDKKEFERKLNQYIKDIDKTINLLSH